MMAGIDGSEIQTGQGLQAVSDLVDIAGRLRASSVIIPGGSRLEDLRLVDAARDNGIIDRIILVGKRDQVHEAVAASGMDIDRQDIVAVDSDEAVAQATVAHIRQGDADIVLKGDISTPILNRAMLPLAERPTVSLVSIFDAAPIAKGRPVILTDAGVTTVCNMGRMIDLIHNAVHVAQVVMDIARPRVAILSANEKQIPSLPSTWMGLALARRTWEDAVVCGPLSFDLATSEKSVEVKGMPDLPGAREVAGQADVLVCPGIDAANILYKALTAMTRYGQASIAGITVGFPIPYIILSRADALETRLDSIALCSVYAQKRAKMQRDAASHSAVPGPRVRRVLAVIPQTQSVQLAVYEGSQCTDAFSVPGGPGASQAVFQAVQKRHTDPLAAVITGTRGADFQCNDSIYDPVLIVNQGEGQASSDPAVQLTETLARQYQAIGLMVPCGNPRLRIRAAARRAAQDLSRPVDQMNLVVAHLGPESVIAGIRTGQILCCTVWPRPESEARTARSPLPAPKDVNLMDLTAHIEKEGWAEIEQRITGDDQGLRRCMDAVTLHLAQEIGGAFVALDCIVEAIVLAGEWMQGACLRNGLRKRIVRLAPVQVFQGSMDMAGLAGDAQDVLSDRVEAQPMSG